VCARRPETAADVVRRFGCQLVPWEDRAALAGEVLINATPIGMAPEVAAAPIPLAQLDRFRLVVDVVANPPRTRLAPAARQQGIEAIDGLALALAQACHQFELYTGHDAPLQAMRAAVDDLDPKPLSARSNGAYGQDPRLHPHV